MKILFFSLFLFCSLSFAKVEVAFLEFRRPDGTLQQLEPGGRFAHIAISYHGLWLHAHPYRGVELLTTEQLRNLTRSTSISIVSLPNNEELTEAQLNEFIGKPFDATFSWQSESYYCSKLIAKILDIEPMPMTFSAAMWPEEYKKKKGQLGISPDEIYAHITNPNYTKPRGLKCKNLFQ